MRSAWPATVSAVSISGPSERLAQPGAVGGSDVVLAVDLAGGAFDAGLVTWRGDLLDRSRLAIDPDKGAARLFDDLAHVVDLQRERAAQHGVKIRAVGVACPGPIGRDLSTVSPINIPAWYNFELGQALRSVVDVPVFGGVDAASLALSEGWMGAAREVSDFGAITVSEGVGGAVMAGGQLLEGAHGQAGQVGHVIVLPGGRRCTCGAQGCLEAEASGLAIESLTGRPTTAPSYEIMQRTGTLIGRAAATMCLTFDLELVVVGGSVAYTFAATLFASAQEELDRLTSSVPLAPRIVSARLGDRGPLVGAAALGIRGFNRSRRVSPR